MPNIPKAKCPKCRGRGVVPLPRVLRETLAALKPYGFGITGADLARQMGLNPTAVNNRLEKLHVVKHATRRKAGREVLYFPKA